MPRGHFRIVIEGTGSHHENSVQDADYLARRLVIDLGNQGHTVNRAQFTPGGPNQSTGKPHETDDLDVKVGQNVEKPADPPPARGPTPRPNF